MITMDIGYLHGEVQRQLLSFGHNLVTTINVDGEYVAVRFTVDGQYHVEVEVNKLTMPTKLIADHVIHDLHTLMQEEEKARYFKKLDAMPDVLRSAFMNGRWGKYGD